MCSPRVILYNVGSVEVFFVEAIAADGECQFFLLNGLYTSEMYKRCISVEPRRNLLLTLQSVGADL
jgi:hypothetical protein